MNWTQICIHHSAIPERDTNAAQWGDIRHVHEDIHGWRDIGYHFGVEKIDGRIEVLVGRPLTMRGAHARPVNGSAIGVCLIGNYEEQSTPHDMLSVATRRIIVPLMEVFDISKGGIILHRDVSNTLCPGKNITHKIIRKHVKKQQQ